MTVTFLAVGVDDVLAYRATRSVDSGEDMLCTLYSEAGSEIQAETAADIGPSTTLDGAAAAGATTIPLTATTDIVVGEVYHVGPNALGEAEDVTVSSITAGVSVGIRHPLVYTYAAADVFESRLFYLEVAAASLTTPKKNCRAKWTYTDTDGLVRVEQSVFHISRYAPRCTVTEADILRRMPTARDWTIPDQPLTELIEDVFADEVLGDLAVMWTPEATISGDSLRLATMSRVCAQLALVNEKPETYDRWMDTYRTDLERAVGTMPIDTDDDGASDDELRYHPGSLHIVRC